MTHRFRTLLATLVAGTALLATGAGQAYASTVTPARPGSGTDTQNVAPRVTCSGYGCDGQWPDISGCANTAITAESTTIYWGDNEAIGRIDLRYSTACRTVWARVLSYYDGGVGETATVIRNSDGADHSCYTYLYSQLLGAYSCYTEMLYDGGVTSFANGYSPVPGQDYTEGAGTASY
jgi:hypothetical protein